MRLKAGHGAQVKSRRVPMTTETINIQSVLVGDEQRLDFLPEFFGANLMLVGESYVYNFMGWLSTADYKGGYWNFYKLTNGGFYLAPHMSKKLRLSWAGNGYEGVVSADAAGVIATLFALGLLAERYSDERLVDLYHHLRDYVAFHPESSEIYAAID